MSGLVEFLHARLDEDEQAARETVGDEQFQHWAEHEAGDYNEGALVWHGRRMLAEVVAKRRLIELHRPTISEFHLGETEDGYGTVNPACPTCGTPDEYAVQAPCPTLRLLALPYADHPDYRAEGWKP